MYNEIEEDNLAAVVNSNETVIVQFSASWCGNCRLMKPKFKRFASEHETIPFIMVDAERFPESRKLAQVNNLPTFAVFRNGTLVEQIQTNKAANLKQLIDEVTVS